MIPATSQASKNIRKQIGPAVWLFLLLASSTPAQWDGEAPAWVAGGNVVSDVELSTRLGVSQKTLSKWRSRLHAVGVIGWLVSVGQGRAYWVRGVNSALGTDPAGCKAPEEKPVTAKAEMVLTTPVASRWLQ
jgi:hypothetical protein